MAGHAAAALSSNSQSLRKGAGPPDPRRYFFARAVWKGAGARASMRESFIRGGKSVAIGKTIGERQDVTAAFGLTNGKLKNIAFKVTFNCTAGLMPMIVGIGPDRQYHALGSNRSC